MKRVFAWRKFGRFVAAAIGLIVVSGGFAWGINAIFTIRSVEVSGEGIAIAVDQAKLPKNLLFFPTDTVTQQILSDYPLVGSVVIKKKYPGTLVITAVPREPFVVAGVPPETYALDAQGVVLSQYPSAAGLPVIRILVPPLQPGDTVGDQRVAAAIRFLRETASFLSVFEVVAFDSTSLQAQAEGMSIRFAQDVDGAVLARTLQTLIAGFRIKGTLPQTLDLRFDKPVVTF